MVCRASEYVADAGSSMEYGSTRLAEEEHFDDQKCGLYRGKGYVMKIVE